MSKHRGAPATSVPHVPRRYQLLDPLRPEERAALKADIAAKGVLVPVEMDTEGNVLDGHQRVEIARELGIDYPKISRQFASEVEKQEHALKMNLLRRQMGPITWGKAFKRLLEVRGVQRGARTDLKHSPTVRLCAAELGVPRATAFRRLALVDQLSAAPDLAEKVDRGEMESKRALRVLRERKAAARVKKEPIPDVPANVDIRIGDFRSVLDLSESSVDLLFTDPPYPKDYLGLWRKLGVFAARVLKPGRLLITYTGQYHLPVVLSALAESLEYVWLGALVTPGQHNQVQRRWIRSAAKPLLFFAKGPYEPREWFDDAYISEGRQKENHRWQQSLGAARYYIERLSKPDETICDPFLGSGTTAVAAHELGRRFVGCDADAKAVALARRRVADGAA